MTTAERYHIAPVDSREELIYLLSRASEIEHGLACVYLYAAHSLKSDPAEGGIDEAQARMLRDWKRRLARVAVEEMLHLAQVTNLLTAIGGAPHFRRHNFPLPADAFPFGIPLALEPFSLELIERLVCYEMPEAGVLAHDRQAFFDAMRERVAPALTTTVEAPSPWATEPFEVDFRTVGEFYHKIATGFTTIPEDVLFIGPPEAQAKARYLDFAGQLVAVTDAASACAAIEMIVAQGEAPSAEHPDAHFFVFDGIRAAYVAERERCEREGIPFDPVRPVVRNPKTHEFGDGTGGTPIRDPIAHEVADLYNVAYDTMLLMLLRFFAHTEETESELEALSRATLRLMASALRPLGEALAKLPAGTDDGAAAGPGFGFARDIHLLPHKGAAWTFFSERLDEIARKSAYFAGRSDLPAELAEASAAIQDAAAHIGALAPRRPGAQRTAEAIAAYEAPRGTAIAPEHDGPYLVTNLPRLTNSKGETLPLRTQLALCRCGQSRMKPYCDGSHADARFEDAKLADRTPDRLDRYLGREGTVLDNRGTCCHAGRCTDNLPAVFHHDSEPFVDPDGADAAAIIAIVHGCPSGALAYERAGDHLAGVARGPEIYVSKDGPYHVRGGIDLVGAARNAGASREHYALCRCGRSKNKPFCDGTHWYVGFRDEAN